MSIPSSGKVRTQGLAAELAGLASLAARAPASMSINGSRRMPGKSKL